MSELGRAFIGPWIFDPYFHVCVHEAIDTPDFVAQFDRLYGTNLARRGAPVELAVDDASGRSKADMEKFVKFVRAVVYEPTRAR